MRVRVRLRVRERIRESSSVQNKFSMWLKPAIAFNFFSLLNYSYLALL